MALSKKHFEAIAAAVKLAGEQAKASNAPIQAKGFALQAVFNVANNLADVCAKENANFNRSLFLAACGVN